jgi:hypothetical protein
MDAYIHACIHAYLYVYTYVRTFKHTYLYHIYIYKREGENTAGVSGGVGEECNCDRERGEIEEREGSEMGEVGETERREERPVFPLSSEGSAKTMRIGDRREWDI